MRGAAVGLTFFSHVTMMLPFHADTLLKIFSIYMPWTGVDLFFCISGFVVSKAYLDYFDKHRTQGQSGLAAACFWLRRAYRLLPTAWLWILIPLVFSIVFNQSNAFGSWYENLRSFTAVATFSGNLAMHYNSLLGPSPQLWGILLCLFTRTRLYQQIEPLGLGQGTFKPLLCTLFLLYMLGAVAIHLITSDDGGSVDINVECWAQIECFVRFFTDTLASPHKL